MREPLALLAVALLHFVWQGAALAAVATVAARMIARASSRYLVLCVALAAMPVSFATTVVVLFRPEVAPGASVATASEPHEWLRWVASLWMVGVAVGVFRLVRSWLDTERMRGGVAAPEWLRDNVLALASRMGIRRPIDVRINERVASPATFGWLRVAIVVPASAIARLSPAQLDCVLTHELAHIRRHDYLINVLQCLVEVVLFYHPAVWLVSKRIRVERENCCDDVAASADPILMARTLEVLATIREERRTLALAAAGPGVRGRILRLLGRAEPERPARPVLAVFAAVPLFAVLLIHQAPNAVERYSAVSRIQQAIQAGGGAPPRFTGVSRTKPAAPTQSLTRKPPAPLETSEGLIVSGSKPTVAGEESDLKPPPERNGTSTESMAQVHEPDGQTGGQQIAIGTPAAPGAPGAMQSVRGGRNSSLSGRIGGSDLTLGMSDAQRMMAADDALKKYEMARKIMQSLPRG